MIQYEQVNLIIEESVATIQLNRPSKKNAMGPTLMQNLNDALTEIEKTEDVKVVVVTGVGNSFCSGVDLESGLLEKEFGESDNNNDAVKDKNSWAERLKTFPKVTVAKVNGWCFGGGLVLAGVCDIVIANEEAGFGLPEIKFGFFPGGGATWIAAHNLPRKQALYYALTGDTFTGREAAEYGLVTKAVPVNQLDAETERIVDLLIDKQSLALKLAKEVYERSIQMTFSESVEWEGDKLIELSKLSQNSWVDTGLKQFRKNKYSL